MNALLRHVWGRSPAQDRVWAQVTGLAPERAIRRLLLVLNFQAFIDESTSTALGEFVLAGHIAMPAAWANLVEGWQSLLPLGVLASNGKYRFKMIQMARTPEKMVSVPLFYKLIEDNVTASISCRINTHDLNKAIERVIIYMRQQFSAVVNVGKFSNPYYICFRFLLDKFHSEREKFEPILPLNQKVDFIFDNRTEKKAILGAWDEYLSNRDDAVKAEYGATPRFEDDDDFLALQAADLWAWWVREWYEYENSPLPEKMEKFDFGDWKGKSRPCIALYANEDDLFDSLLAAAVESFFSENGNKRPLGI